MMPSFTRIASAVLAIVAGAMLAATPARAEGMRAFAVIKGCNDEPGIIGRLDLVERPSAEGVKVVDVTLEVVGLSDGKHAVHIHETGKCRPCGAANGHFDPGPAGRSSPDGNHPYHSGDLVNVEVVGGKGRMQTISSRITLSSSPLSVFDADGSALIIHTEPDSYCPGGEVKGCAGGARAACGVIEPQ